MNKVDVTLSVLINTAAVEYQDATGQIVAKLGVSEDIAEIALEKELMRLRDKKMKLYATAMYGDFQSKKGGSNGNSDN